MVKSIKKPLSSRDKFVRELSHLEKTEPFTKAEREKTTFQERNFIRGIQITKGVKKRDAITEFKRIKGKKEKIRKQGDAIQERYTGEKRFKSRIREGKKVCKPVSVIERKREYTFKGVTKRASNTLIERFIRDDKSPKSARRYIDRLSGDSISRRERDKRISRALDS
jgi:hypothetical protein